MRKVASFMTIWSVCSLGTASLAAGTLKATFANGSLTAIEGNSNLSVVGTPNFSTTETAVLSGQTRTVYRWGNTQNIGPSLQTGLSLDPNGLIANKDFYSIEMMVKFESNLGPSTNFIRVLDTSNRTSDNGLYLNSGTPWLRLFGTGAVTGIDPQVSYNAYHHIVVTNDTRTGQTPNVRAYVDGAQVFFNLGSPGTNSTELKFINDSSLAFFLDNTTGGVDTEYAGGLLAMLRVYDGVLTDSEVTALNSDPFNGIPLNGASVPEPSMLGVMGVTGLGLCGFLWRRCRRKYVVGQT